MVFNGIILSLNFPVFEYNECKLQTLVLNSELVEPIC